ncbi:MAG: A24 family peptidase [Desulfobacca sp.]|uniref:A24 family peptidase n=1 Tax=Desulfobacca sp. TaxID=2067990 RepID=UPI00404B6C1C
MYILSVLPPGSWSPLLLSLVMAGWDLRTRRIPNFLTFGGALAGIVFQTIFLGWSGLGQALAGMALGLLLLLLPYVLGGMGAGDVKALAALGAWLGPGGIFSVFCYMGLAGGLLSLAVLLWTGKLWHYLRQGWLRLVNFLLLRGQQKILLETITPGNAKTVGIPYGVAICLGMVMYLQWGNVW